MKFFVAVFALAALAHAEPEAEASGAYGAYGLASPLGLGLGYGRGLLRTPAATILAPAAITTRVIAAPAIRTGHLWKREAEADASGAYNLGLGLAAPYGYAIPAASGSISVNAAGQSVVAGPSGTLIDGLPVVSPAARLWKREAEPEAEASGAYGLGLGYAAAPAVIARQAVIATPASTILPGPSGSIGINAAGQSVVAGPSATLIDGVPVYSAAARLWKREAEPEAEASGAYGLGLGLRGLGYAAGPAVIARKAVIAAPAATILPGPSGSIGINAAGQSVVAGPSATLVDGVPVYSAAARLWKREAEPEAEASGAYGLGLGLGGLGYAAAPAAVIRAPLVARRTIIGAPLLARGAIVRSAGYGLW